MKRPLCLLLSIVVFPAGVALAGEIDDSAVHLHCCALTAGTTERELNSMPELADKWSPAFGKSALFSDGYELQGARAAVNAKNVDPTALPETGHGSVGTIFRAVCSSYVGIGGFVMLLAGLSGHGRRKRSLKTPIVY
jgi:hypothetical protein